MLHPCIPPDGKHFIMYVVRSLLYSTRALPLGYRLIFNPVHVRCVRGSRYFTGPQVCYKPVTHHNSTAGGLSEKISTLICI